VLDEADPNSFRVRAYETAAQAIAAQASDLGRLTPRELQQIPGIGKSTADKVRELLETGEVRKLEELRRKYPRGLVALLRIQGLGPKALQAARELGVESIDDLRRRSPGTACCGSRGLRREVRGEARSALVASRRRAPRPHADLGRAAARERIVARLLEVPGVSQAIPAARCGASARRSATSTWWLPPRARARDGALVVDALVERVLVRGDVEDQRRHRRGAGRPARRRRAPARRGAALLHRLEGHNIKLRQRALRAASR
jgi:DNA polymerase (family 10)